jgi:hypothetical protein
LSSAAGCITLDRAAGLATATQQGAGGLGLASQRVPVETVASMYWPWPWQQSWQKNFLLSASAALLGSDHGNTVTSEFWMCFVL